MSEPLQQLSDGLQKMALTVSEQQMEKLIAYLYLLRKWNKTYNLTAIRQINEMVSQHLLDSLSLLPYLTSGDLLDIGSGAGLPGIPLAVCCPDMKVTLMDSNGKKVRFMRQAMVELQLKNVIVEHHRIEKYPVKEKYSMITARAWTSLQDIIKFSQDHLADTGVFLLMKGQYPEQEISQIQASWKIQTYPLDIPGVKGERHLVKLKKSN